MILKVIHDILYNKSTRKPMQISGNPMQIRLKSKWMLFFTVLNILFITHIQCTSHYITDVSKLTKTPIAALERPSTIAELRKIVIHANKPISIVGGGFSQGGQIACPDGIVIDITGLNRILDLDVAKKRITVQAGITWRDIQRYIDQENLSVKVMQSYNDFTVGGTLSVNAHARSMEYGQIIETVDSIKIMLADGSIVIASRDENKELFITAIGGYGLMGIIVGATLQLTDNVKIERIVKHMHINNYPDFFFKTVKPDKNIVFHSAVLYPDKLQTVLSETYYKTDKKLTIPDRMQTYKRFFPKQMIEEQFVRRLPFLKYIRPKIETKRWQKKEVMWRNYEMSYTVRALEPLIRFPTTTILQEYFIPVDKLIDFVDKLRNAIKKYNINMINVSIRHVPKNTESLLTYAPQESFALVLYINMFNTRTGKERAQEWTQKLIDHALTLGGTYYLPYQLYATRKQLYKAYPNFKQLLEIKKKYDPLNKFRNRLFEKYR